jgi:hypothetical protein
MKVKFSFLMLFVGLALPQKSQAQTPNWSEDVASIVYTHCTSCHRPGEVGPFPLTNYQEAVAWGNMIQYVTEIKYMPPWKPDANYGPDFLKDNSLTEDEIATIKAWVDGGMPEGDPALAPNLPTYPTGSQIGTPDLVLSFAQIHNHPGNGLDEYRYFVIPTGLTTPQNLVALEMRPGNTRIVHHALVWADSTGTAAANDAQTPEYGYEGGQGGGFAFGTQLPGYVPGQNPHVYSNGIAQRIPANADLVVQMHYAPTTVDEPDSSVFNLFFSDGVVDRYVQSKIMVPFGGTLLNGPFIIPANQTREFHGVWEVPQEVSMLGIAPHMHLLGTHWEVYGITPNNDTIHLIRISDWDFNWQGSFYFKNLIRLPQGTKIHALAGYDNTVNNPNNPNNPPELIIWGEGTADEMYYLPLLFVPYKPGDEELVLDDVLTDSENPTFHFAQTKLYPIAPNPVGDASVRIGFTLANQSAVSLSVFDLSGQLSQKIINNKPAFAGEHIASLDVSSMPNGLYVVMLEANGKICTQKMIVQR